MQLYKQVCTLAQSARLVELGVNIEPFLWWVQERAYPDNCNVLTAEHKPKGIDIDAFIILPAYTVAELGEMLPIEYGTLPDEYPEKEQRIYYAVKSSRFGDYNQHLPVDFETEAEARAAMLIHLLEQGVLKPEQINQNK
jgi:hypothetical protein